jgi:hypothetical protein
MDEQDEKARGLEVLVPLIKRDIEAAATAGDEHYRAAGEKLWEAKSQLLREAWGGWLRDNFELSQRKAQNWMKFAQQMEDASATLASRAPRRLYRPFARPVTKIVSADGQNGMSGCGSGSLTAQICTTLRRQDSRLRPESGRKSSSERWNSKSSTLVTRRWRRSCILTMVGQAKL